MTNSRYKKTRICQECKSLFQYGGRPRRYSKYCSTKCGGLAKTHSSWAILQIGKAHSRRKLVLELRNKGKTFKEIGEELGVSRARAEQIASAARKALTKQRPIE